MYGMGKGNASMKLLEITPCPFCGGEAELKVVIPKYYGLTGAFVRCEKCCARGPLAGVSECIRRVDGSLFTPTTGSSIERGKIKAVRSWNERRAAQG